MYQCPIQSSVKSDFVFKMFLVCISLWICEILWMEKTEKLKIRKRTTDKNTYNMLHRFSNIELNEKDAQLQVNRLLFVHRVSIRTKSLYFTKTKLISLKRKLLPLKSSFQHETSKEKGNWMFYFHMFIIRWHLTFKTKAVDSFPHIEYRNIYMYSKFILY